MDSNALGILLGNIFISFFIALLGRNREIGYAKSLLWCVLTSPVIGLIRIMASDEIVQNDTTINFEPITPQQMKATTETPMPQVNTTNNTWTTTFTADDDLFSSQETNDDANEIIPINQPTQEPPGDSTETKTDDSDVIGIFILVLIAVALIIRIVHLLLPV